MKKKSLLTFPANGKYRKFMYEQEKTSNTPEYICMQPNDGIGRIYTQTKNFYTNKQNVSELTTEFNEFVSELENFQLINEENFVEILDLPQVI